jgi:hypothetical protein
MYYYYFYFYYYAPLLKFTFNLILSTQTSCCMENKKF